MFNILKTITWARPKSILQNIIFTIIFAAILFGIYRTGEFLGKEGLKFIIDLMGGKLL